ncbi:MAG TPA: helix-turn-helix domain-containing protein, partial [Gaiellales bacterium]
MNLLTTNSPPVRRADQRAVRKSNLSLVARRIAEAGSLSRAQLAKSTGLNKTTVSSLVSELIERGVVAESGVADGGRVGRPAQILELDDSRIAALGLEINVDYLAVCVCDLRGAVRYRAAVGHDNRGSL